MIERLGFVLLAALVATVGIGVAAAPAYARPAKPPTDESYYMSSTSTDAAYNLGCTQAQQDNSTGHDSFVVLDFGIQNSANTGTIDVVHNNTWSYSTDESIAEWFALGYWVCVNTPGPTLFLGVGTNNSVSANVTTAAGQTWGDVVNVVANWVQGGVGQVIVDGANDIENWNGVSYSTTLNWESGYASHTGTLYLNFGSADGCPTTSYGDGGCNGSWDQYDYWNISWGLAPAITSPEIYIFDQARQWHMISAYGSVYQGRAAYYSAPWDQYPACNCTYTATSAWNNLWDQMNTVAPTISDTFPYSMEIRYQ